MSHLSDSALRQDDAADAAATLSKHDPKVEIVQAGNRKPLIKLTKRQQVSRVQRGTSKCRPGLQTPDMVLPQYASLAACCQLPIMEIVIFGRCMLTAYLSRAVMVACVLRWLQTGK